MKKDYIAGGKADNLTPEDLAKKHKVSVDVINKELDKGVKIEMEHTNDNKIAREIAMDHVDEFVDYYSNKKNGLIHSEKELEKESINLSIKSMLREALIAKSKI